MRGINQWVVSVRGLRVATKRTGEGELENRVAQRRVCVRGVVNRRVVRGLVSRLIYLHKLIHDAILVIVVL